jgi:hypothetical protein
MGNRPIAPVRRIAAVAHDIGGAQAISPVIAKLRRRPGVQVTVIAGQMAQKTLARFRPENTSSDWPEAQIEEFLEKNRIDLVLSGTSWKSRLEQGFRNCARARNLPSVVVIDFWSNYRLRWHDATYRFEDGYDHVCVMDAAAATAINKEGYPVEQLIVTGQPHLERCYQRGGRFQSRSNNPRFEVLFLTISLDALGLKDDPVAPIRTICQALELAQATNKQPVALTIRPHPHENPEPQFINRVRAIAPAGLSIQLADRTKPILGQLKRSDLVLGYITMGLFEARSLGKQAIAIKLADHPPELIAVMGDAGIRLVPFDSKDIASAIHQPRITQRVGNTHVGAASAVARLCRDLMSAKV